MHSHAHAHTLTHTHARTRTHTHAHAHTHMHTHAHGQTSFHSLAGTSRGPGDAGMTLYAGDGRGRVHVVDARAAGTQRDFAAHKRTAKVHEPFVVP